MAEHRETEAIQVDLINAMRQEKVALAHLQATELAAKKASSDYADSREAVSDYQDELRSAIRHLASST